jgi:xanthosine phosphorylase
MSGDPYAAAEIIRRHAPRAGLILGSGLAALAERIEDAVSIPYEELPGFPVSQVAGHINRLVLGRLAGLPVACFQGRRHFYEGDAAAMRGPIRALKLAGADILVLTNAAGSLRPEVGPGRLVAVSDHINFQPGNPLIGPNDDAIGPRFPSLRDAYDPTLRDRLKAAADEVGVELAQGVYLAYSGPSFETPAEIRAFRMLGADLVGMSTVPEVILARHCGLRVAAVSVVTNLAEGIATAPPLSHAHTLAVATEAGNSLGRLLEAFFAAIADE